MERIVIEVNKAAAKKWRASTQQQKKKLAALLQRALVTEGTDPVAGHARPSEEMIKAHFGRVQNGLPEYLRLMDELSKKAAERGLTEEILNELLRNE